MRFCDLFWLIVVKGFLFPYSFFQGSYIFYHISQIFVVLKALKFWVKPSSQSSPSDIRQTKLPPVFCPIAVQRYCPSSLWNVAASSLIIKNWVEMFLLCLIYWGLYFLEKSKSCSGFWTGFNPLLLYYHRSKEECIMTLKSFEVICSEQHCHMWFVRSQPVLSSWPYFLQAFSTGSGVVKNVEEWIGLCHLSGFGTLDCVLCLVQLVTALKCWKSFEVCLLFLRLQKLGSCEILRSFWQRLMNNFSQWIQTHFLVVWSENLRFLLQKICFYFSVL